MATQSPFLLLQGFAQSLAANFQAPPWVIDEAQRRIVLLLNHVLMQEQEATTRLVRQKGRIVQLQWRTFSLRLMATPAGLLDLAPVGSVPDLSLAVTDDSPFSIAQVLLRGDKPAVRIEGDVQLAAEVNWLADNVRWDIEEDLSRAIGDVPAHTLGQAARRVAQAVRQFATNNAAAPGAGGTPA